MTALVLGGTTPHISLIEHLHMRGYQVILVDYLDNPPAKEYADIHIKESTLDKEAVLKIASENNVDLVVSACIDQANSVCCYVAEQLDLPHPYSYDTSILVTVKTEMKRIFKQYDIPTSWYKDVDEEMNIDWSDITFPAVVKPADCNSSKGVKSVENKEQAVKFLKEALNFSRSKKAIIEGYVNGIEIQVDCMAETDNAYVVMTRQKKKLSSGKNDELNSSGSIIPSPVCESISSELNDIAKKIAKAFSLENTPFFYQAIVDKNNEVNVLEFAPRVGGGLSYYLLKKIAGFDAVDAVIDSYLGMKKKHSIMKPDKYYSTNLLYMNEGVFDHISGFEEAEKNGIIMSSFVTKKTGDVIDGSLKSGNRVGAFIVCSDSPDDLINKEKEAYGYIDIIDTEGRSVIKKWRNRIETPC